MGKTLTLQLSRPLPQDIRQILQIITSRDPKLPHKIPRRALQIAVIPILVSLRHVVFRSTEVGVAANGRSAFEALETLLGFCLGGSVEVVAAEEFVRGDAFLGSEFFAGVFFVVVWGGWLVRCLIALSRDWIGRDCTYLLE